jgi:hypothetical protein
MIAVQQLLVELTPQVPITNLTIAKKIQRVGVHMAVAAVEAVNQPSPS